MIPMVAGGVSQSGLRRLVIAGGILASVVVGLGRPAVAQTNCDDAIVEPSVESVDRLVEVADCHRATGRLDRAVTLLEAAASNEDGSTFAETIAIHGRLGQLHAARGDYARAIEHLLLAIDSAPAAAAPPEAAALLNDLGGAYMANDQALLGLAAFADSARLAGTASAVAVTASVNAVRALHETGAALVTAAPLERARATAEALPPTPGKASILLALAALYREIDPAAPTRGRALATTALALAEDSGDTALIAAAHGEVGAASAAANDYAAALRHTRQAVLLAQSSDLRDSQYRYEWQMGRLLRALDRPADALTSYEAAVATLDTTTIAAATSRRGFRRDVLPLYEEYADLMLAQTNGLNDDQANAALRTVQRNLEQLRVAEVRNYFENQCSVPTVADRLPAAERALVIYPLLFADRLELLVSSGDELRQVTVAVGAAELTRAVRLLRDAIADPASATAYLDHSRRLYGWLIEPLRDVLEQADPSTLVFVPDGPLRTIPLAVLHDGSRFLIERYALATTPALSLVGAASVEPVGRVLVGGLIAPTRGFAGLPFVAAELRSIEQTFPARVYADDAFVTATLEREILAGGYSVVHMATHAQFESDYRRSFLLAYDDVITMDDLEDVMGSQRFSANPVDLLVLSACQTAAGDERAALGLAGVAVKAGARSALASLWSIGDESTARLIAEFYRQLGDGNGKAAALRGAQLLLRNDERYAHPAYWAPFLMIGDWR